MFLTLIVDNDNDIYLGCLEMFINYFSRGRETDPSAKCLVFSQFNQVWPSFFSVCKSLPRLSGCWL